MPHLRLAEGHRGSSCPPGLRHHPARPPASGSAPTCLQRLQEHELALLIVAEEAGEEPLRGLPLSLPLGEDLARDVLLLQRLPGRRAWPTLVRSSCHAIHGPHRCLLLPRVARGETRKSNHPLAKLTAQGLSPRGRPVVGQQEGRRVGPRRLGQRSY